MCEHERFVARVSVSNPRDLPDEADEGYTATITVRCGLCGLPFEFVGVSQEPCDERPFVDTKGTEMIVPLRPHGDKPKVQVH